MISYNMLDCNFLCSYIPELKEEIYAENEYLGENLPHCLFGNILNPLVVRMLRKDNFRENPLLIKIFEMYENLAIYGDMETRNLLQVTLLEYLWDEYLIYSRAVAMMGGKTREINEYISEYIRKPNKI
ncbi:MAG: hypothetical protein K2J08_12905 [Ruminococcus sp.]|nr:hypothetical protein [Ruminococcus sp.]